KDRERRGAVVEGVNFGQMGEPADDERQNENAGQQPPQHFPGRRLLDDGGGNAVFGRGGKQPERKQQAADGAIERHRGERERVIIGGDAIGVTREHDQHLGDNDEREDLAERRGDASLLGVKQSEPEQDQRAGNAGRYMQGLARGRGVGEEDLGANQRLV